MAFVAEIDVDDESNKSPHQQLEDTESIYTMIVPLSKLSELIKGRFEEQVIRTSRRRKGYCHFYYVVFYCLYIVKYIFIVVQS